MSIKSDNFYFDNFSSCAEFSYTCAIKLRDILDGFDKADLSQGLKDLHKIENDADREKHKMIAELAGAFITPIERDDIMNMAQTLDDVTDAIEDVLIKIYMCGIEIIRPDVLKTVDVIINICNALKNALAEFHNFKKSKTLKGLLVEINNLEEEGDALFISSMRKLHTTEPDVKTILVWRDIYEQLEFCCDTCEHVADIIERVIIENT